MAEKESESTGETQPEAGSGCRSWFRKYFALQPHISIQHCVVYFIAVTFTIAAYVYVNQAQQLILKLGMHIREVGTAHGTLLLSDEILAICLLPIWGFISDFTGRRVLYSAGFIIVATSFLLFPYSTAPYPIDAPSFFTSMMFFRLIFALGGSIIGSLMAAFLSDTAALSCNGRFAGVIGFFCGIGALFGGFIFPRIAIWCAPRKIFVSDLDAVNIGCYIMAAIEATVAILVLIFISPGPPKVSSEVEAGSDADLEMQKSEPSCPVGTPPYFTSHPNHPCRTRTQKVRHNIIMSFKAMKNPMIVLAYVSGFVARTATLIYHGFFGMWIGAHNAPRMASLQGTLDLVTLIVSPLYGFLANKVSGPISISIACFFCLAAHSIMILIKDPMSKIHFVSAMLAGAGQAGFTISGLALVSHYAPKSIRGAISSAYSFYGGLGILVNSLVAGKLFDSWTPVAPFVILMGWATILLISTIGVSIATRVRRARASLEK